MKMKPAELRLSLCIVVVRKIAVDEHDIIGACCECLIPICELHFTRMNVKHQNAFKCFLRSWARNYRAQAMYGGSLLSTQQGLWQKMVTASSISNV